MAKNEVKTTFIADTSKFREQVKEASSSLTALRAGMALNEAEFKKTGDSSEYLKNKQALLQAELDQNRAKQEALTGTLQKAKSVYGENSQQVQSWETKLTKAQTEEQKLEKELIDTNKAIEDQAAAEKKAETPLEQLNKKIEDQRKQLSNLQTEYANAALAEGKDSKAAKELKQQIDILNKELDENETQLKEVTSATTEAGNAAKKSSGGWSYAKQILADFISGAIRDGINKLKEMSKEVINLGKDFTSSMSNVEALSGAVGNELTQLEETAKALGRSTIFTAADVADAFSYMALAGWETEEMLDGVNGVLNLAAAGNMDLAQASDMVTDYLTAFGLAAQDSAHMVDMMTYAQANSNTTAEGLGEAFKNSAAMMHTAGQSMETTTAVLESFANQGLKGSEAGTALSAMMRDITQKMGDGKIMIGDTAVEVQDANGNFRNMIDILDDVSAATDGMGTAEKSAALMTTFTARSVKGVSMALNEGADTLRKYETELLSCDGTAEQMAATMQDNLAGDMKALESATQGLGLAIFDGIEEPLRSAADFGTRALNWLTDAITPTRSELGAFIDEIRESNQQVEETLHGVESSMNDMTSNAAELDYYGSLLVDLNSKASLTEFEQYQLKNAVDALSGSIPELADAYDEATGSLKLTNGEIESLITNAQKAAIQNALIKAQADIYDALAEAMLNEAKAGSAVEKAQENLNNLMQDGADITDELGNAVGADAEAYQHYSSELSAAQSEQIKAKNTVEDLNGELNQLGDTWEYLAEENDWNESFEDIVTGANNSTEAIGEMQDGVTGTGEIVEDEFEKVLSALGMTEEEFDKFRDSVRDSMQESINMFDEFSGGTEVSTEEIIANLDSQIEGLSAWSNNMETLAGAAGEGMTQEFYKYLLEMGPKSANLVQELVDALGTEDFKSITQKWGKALELSDKADVLAQVRVGGESVTKEMSKSIENGKDSVDTSVRGITSDIESLVENSTSKVGNTMDRAVSSVSRSVSNIGTAVNQTFTGPYIRTPHFSMNGTFNPETGAVPTVSVAYYAKGGIFSRPTFFATPYGGKVVGESGTEVVAPIERLQQYVSEAVEDKISNVYNTYITVDGGVDPASWAQTFMREMKQYERIG